MTRKEARLLGLLRYNTGIPCARGHLSDRYTKSAKCLACEYQQHKRWRSKTPERQRAWNRRMKEWAFATPERRKLRRIARKLYESRNPNYALRRNLSRRVRSALGRHSQEAFELLGCSIDDFKSHISKMFKKGMTWENYGSLWHLDHIIPLAAFDLTDPMQQKSAFNFLNYQPLSKKQNLLKGARRETLL